MLRVVSHTPIECEKLGCAHGRRLGRFMRALTPEPTKLYTWWSYRAADWAAADRGRRLDHVWVSAAPRRPRLVDRGAKEARGWERPSDHVPVTATSRYRRILARSAASRRASEFRTPANLPRCPALPSLEEIRGHASPIIRRRIVTDVPARLERLPWSRFHRLVVTALGITWVLDGLEVTLAGSVAGALRASPALQFSDTDIGLAGSAYLSGAVLGALFFGWLTDRMGRKKLFFITLILYLSATALAGLAWDGCQLLRVPLSHRRRDRRRICRDQLDHPGTGPGA